jgi:hypothetical protein
MPCESCDFSKVLPLNKNLGALGTSPPLQPFTKSPKAVKLGVGQRVDLAKVFLGW